MQRQRLGQDLADGHARVERGIGVLEDDLRVAAEGAQFVGVQRQQVAAFEADVACIRLDQPQYQPADGGFAATGFADQRQRLAGSTLKLTPSTALTNAVGRPNTERSATKCLTRFSTSSSAHHDTSLSSGALMQRDQ